MATSVSTKKLVAVKLPAPPKPPAPAPTATAPAPRPPFVLPPDGLYEQQVAGLGRQRDTALAGLATQRNQSLLDYGYTQGAGGTLAFDPTNPYSQAAVLKRNYNRSRASAGINLSARGQLYSGAYQNAQDYANQQELQASDALQKQLLGFLSRNTQQAAEAGNAYESGVGAAGGDRLSRALEAYRLLLAGG
jgi:hypothetical protein